MCHECAKLCKACLKKSVTSKIIKLNLFTNASITCQNHQREIYCLTCSFVCDYMNSGHWISKILKLGTSDSIYRYQLGQVSEVSWFNIKLKGKSLIQAPVVVFELYLNNVWCEDWILSEHCNEKRVKVYLECEVM